LSEIWEKIAKKKIQVWGSINGQIEEIHHHDHSEKDV
jgi:hypothetical protein